MIRTIIRTAVALAVSSALVPATGPALAAQDDPGFLLGTPKASLGLRIGYSIPRANSEVFTFTEEQLTVDQADFGGLSIIGDIGIRTSERLDILLSLGYSISETRSEFRDWEDEAGLPIEQVTQFSMVPFTVSAKAYLRDRGRSIGRFAWIPERWSPFVGVGGGFLWYSFEQYGEFVDFETLDIFTDNFSSDGTAPTIHALAGFDVSATSNLVFTLEGRYGWASSPLDADFVGFDDIDLNGFQATAGIGFRF